MAKIFNTNIIADLDKGNQHSAESMEGMTICKMLPNVNTVIVPEEGNSDPQLTQVAKSM